MGLLREIDKAIDLWMAGGSGRSASWMISWIHRLTQDWLNARIRMLR